MNTQTEIILSRQAPYFHSGESIYRSKVLTNRLDTQHSLGYLEEKTLDKLALICHTLIKEGCPENPAIVFALPDIVRSLDGIQNINRFEASYSGCRHIPCYTLLPLSTEELIEFNQEYLKVCSLERRKYRGIVVDDL